MVNIQSVGQGVDVVALHGWGMNRDIWRGVADRLSNCRLHMVDMPGYGGSKGVKAQTIAEVATLVAGAVPENSIWMGWSLGGFVAQQALLQGEVISKLILVDSSASFLVRKQWPHAMSPKVLDGFSQQLADDYHATLRRFMALQARGSEKLKEEIKLLREIVLRYGDPDPDALKLGLSILSQSDFRDQLSSITQPTLMIHGDRDNLIPVAAIQQMAAMIPDAKVVTIQKAGHAPFLSHPNQFIEAVEHFIHE